MVVRMWDNMLGKGDEMTPNDFFLSGSFWTFLGGRSWFSWLLNFDDRQDG